MKKLLLFTLLSLSFSLNAQSVQDTINYPYWQGMMTNFKTNFYQTKRAYNLYFSNKQKEKGTGWKQFERWADYWSRVINKDGTLPAADKVEKAVLKFRRNNLTTRSTTGTWSSVGPSKEPGFGKWAGGTITSAGTGRLNVVAIHPTNSDIMYAGAPQGGLWKTTNAGVSWAQLSNLSANGISAIALFANDANRILVGTGDRDGGDAQGRGFYLSTDGGVNFNFVSIAGITGGGNDFTINKIIVNPVNPNTILATSNSALLKSTDMGATWTFSRLNESFLDIAYCPNDTNTVYLTGNKNSSTSDSFYLSTDGGANFNGSMMGITGTGISRSFAATTDANPNIVYLIRANSKNMEGFYKSSNKGQSWTKLLDPTTFNVLGYDHLGKDTLKGQGFFDVAIYADNLDSNNIVVGGVNLYQSLNGGTNWTARTCWSGCNNLPITHADVHYIVKNTNNNAYFICNDGGLYKTTNFMTFNPIYEGMVISQFYDIDVTQAENNKLVGGLQDNSMVERKNGNWLTHLGGDGMFAEVSDFDPNLMVGSSQNGGLEMTKDGFASASERINKGNDYGIDEDGPWVTPYQMSPSNDHILVGAFTTKVFYTKGLRNLAKNTTSSATSFIGLAMTGEGTAVRFSKSDSNVCFIGTSSGNLYYLNNLANGGTPALIACTSPNAGIKINDIETSSKNAGTLWATVDSFVYKSTDTGKTWTNISYNLPAIKKFAIVSDKNTNFEDIYVGTEGGVYVLQSSSTGAWQMFSNNLPTYSHIRDLEIWYDTACHSNSSLYAGTYGRGAWKSDLYRADDVNYTINGSSAPAANTVTNYNITWATGLTTAFAKWSVIPSAGVTFANNNTDSIAPGILFANPGVYTINVKATNSIGGFCTKTLNVTVGTPATIIVKLTSSSTDNKICVGDSVTLTATGAVSYTISPSVNTTKLNDSTFKVKPTASTEYTITGTGPAGQRAKDSVKITANTENQVTINPASMTSTSGTSIDITASGGISYKWTPSTYLTSPSNDATITSSPTSNIVYTVESIDNKGCKSTATANINVSAVPLNVGAVAVSSNVICKAKKTIIKGQGATSYSLNPMRNAVKLNDSSFEVSPTKSTVYYITGTTGTNTGTDSVLIVVNNIPNVVVNPAVKSINSGSSIAITASGANTYLWSPSSFVSTATNTASITAFPTQNMTYTVVGTKTNGCTASASSNIIISSGNINVEMIKDPSNDSICEGTSMIIIARRTLATNETPTKTTFTLSPMTNVNMVDDTTWEVMPQETTTYYLTGLDENNKLGIDSVNIVVLSTPDITVAPSEEYVQLGSTVTLTASGGASYTWTPTTYVSGSSTSAGLTITPTNYINYEVEVTGTNGCEDYLEVAVGVYTLRTVQIKNCGSYTWNGKILSTNGTYKDTFETSTGIDSIVTLNLTIGNANSGVASASGCKPYIFKGKSYWSSGILKDTLVSSYGCDSIVTIYLTILNNLPLITSDGKTLRASSIDFTSFQWMKCLENNQFQMIANATNSYYVPSLKGSYAVVGSLNGCIDTSACFDFNFLSVPSNTKYSISAYPNPSRGFVHFDFETTIKSGTLVLQDQIGRIIDTKTFSNQSNLEYNMNKLATGIYLFNFYSDSNSSMIKVEKIE